jgi:hypothetical protein
MSNTGSIDGIAATRRASSSATPAASSPLTRASKVERSSPSSSPGIASHSICAPSS